MFCIIVGMGVVLYFVEGIIDADFTMLPFLFVIGDITIALNYDYVHTHDISYVLASHQQKFGARGYVAIDSERQFQSCNDKAFEFLPFLRNQHVDSKIAGNGEHETMVLGLIDTCEQEGFASAHYQIGEMTCACEVRPYSLRRDGDPQGYLLDIRDATEEERNYRIVTEYNEALNAEVQEKTDSIQEIQRKIVLGMHLPFPGIGYILKDEGDHYSFKPLDIKPEETIEKQNKNDN